MATVLKCPSCGASIDAVEDGPIARCVYCGNSILLSPLSPPPSPPVYQGRGFAVPAEPSPALQRLKAVLLLLAAAGIGFGVPMVFHAFRLPHIETLPLVFLVGISALLAGTLGNRLVAALFSAYAGVLFVLKPWVFPIPAGEGRFFSPDSETAYYYIVPGLLLAVLSVVLAISSRRADLQKLRPASFGAAVLVFVGLAGGAAGIWLASLPTRAELYDEFAPRFQKIRQELRVLAQRIDRVPALPPAAASLTPPPDSAESSGRANAVVMEYDNLVDPDAGTALDLYLGGPLLFALRKTTGRRVNASLSDYQTADDYDRRQLESAASTVYVAVFRPGEPPPDQILEYRKSPWSVGVTGTVWLARLPSGELLLRVPLPGTYGSFTDLRKEIYAVLAQAAGSGFADK